MISRPDCALLSAALAAGLLVMAMPAGAQTAPATQSSAAYRPNFAAVQMAMQKLDDDNPFCAMSSLAQTGQGRDVFMLTLSTDPAHASESQPAVLIVAGLDGRHRVGVETALRVAEHLLKNHAELLKNTTFYIVPCANPDGFEFNSGKVKSDHIGNLHSVDSDRDGASDEDGPADLNGDGVITQMRRLSPPLDDRATHLPDPVEPRLLKRADPAKSEHALYSLYVEGLDADGDGEIAEDAVGFVDLDRNFMHRYPEHSSDAGAYPLSEPEALALADFVIKHKNIVATIVYGRHDNMINVPDGRGTDISGQGPRDLDQGDVEYYREISKKYKEITGQTRAAAADTAGSFQAWVYAQRGIPSFATTLWGRPDVKDPAATGPATTAPGGAASRPATQPERGQPSSGASEGGAPPAGERPGGGPPAAGGGRRGGGGGAGRRGGGPPAGGEGLGAGGGPPTGGGAEANRPEDGEGAAWLKYSDTMSNKEGFIEWKPFDHPTLGKVEIGGFVPGFQMNPPASDLDDIGAKQTAFAVDIVGRRPRLNVEGPEVKKLADGLYEIRVGLLNDGYLPTATAMARKARSIFPSIVRISTPIDNIVSGDKQTRTFGVGGSGDRVTYHWIVRADNGSNITVEISNPHIVGHVLTFKAEDTKPK